MQRNHNHILSARNSPARCCDEQSRVQRILFNVDGEWTKLADDCAGRMRDDTSGERRREERRRFSSVQGFRRSDMYIDRGTVCAEEMDLSVV